VAGVVGHSYALIADAVESVADIVGSVVIWGGLHIGARPADDNHPYGHGKAEALAALVVAGLVLSFMSGTTHSYYAVALAPPIGALIGIGAVTAWRIRRTWFARAALAAAPAVTAAWAWVLLGRNPGWYPWLRVVIVIAALLVDVVFGAVGLIPNTRPSRADIFGSIELDYKLVLNVLGLVVFAALFWLSARGGRRASATCPHHAAASPAEAASSSARRGS